MIVTENGEIQMDSVFRKAPGCHVVEVDDGFVVNDAASEQVHFMNVTGALVYEMCDGQMTTQEITQFIDQTFSLSASSSNEVLACLSALEDKDLIVKCPARQ